MKKAVFYDNQTKKKRGRGEESRSVLFTHALCAYYFNYTSLTRNWGQGWGLLLRATLNVFAFCFFFPVVQRSCPGYSELKEKRKRGCYLYLLSTSIHF